MHYVTEFELLLEIAEWQIKFTQQNTPKANLQKVIKLYCV